MLLHLALASMLPDGWVAAISATDLAARAGVTRSTASNWLWRCTEMDPPLLEVVEDNRGRSKLGAGGLPSRFRFLTPHTAPRNGMGR